MFIKPIVVLPPSPVHEALDAVEVVHAVEACSGTGVEDLGWLFVSHVV